MSYLKTHAPQWSHHYENVVTKQLMCVCTSYPLHINCIHCISHTQKINGKNHELALKLSNFNTCNHVMRYSVQVLHPFLLVCLITLLPEWWRTCLLYVLSLTVFCTKNQLLEFLSAYIESFQIPYIRYHISLCKYFMVHASHENKQHEHISQWIIASMNDYYGQHALTCVSYQLNFPKNLGIRLS